MQLHILIRRGRNAEGGAEDPYLMGEVGTAWTRGMQEGRGLERRFLQTVTTLKHFDANSLEGESSGDDGLTRHTIDVNISKYLLADYYWAAFRKTISNAGARGVMCSYNSVRGIPTCLSPLMKAARDSWGFRGYVTSDSDSIADAYKAHKYVPTAAEASCAGVRTGSCDIDSGNTYCDSLQEGVKAGHCSQADVDRAVSRTLRTRFELGLFDPTDDQPYWKLGADDIGTAAAKALNLRLAQSSLVLLQNPNHVLPLKPGGKIAMLGPHANATMTMIQHDTGKICPGLAWQRGHEDGGDNDPASYHCVVSPAAAVRSINGASGGQTTYEQACDVYHRSTAGFAAALAAAKAADIVVLALGIEERLRSDSKTDASDPYRERESHDRSSIDLPEVQKELAKQVIALNKPTVVVLMNVSSSLTAV
jgi:beta-D-xylosidase 4